MKKAMIILSLFLVAFATKGTAQESMTITNTTGCAVSVVLYAVSSSLPGCQTWTSNTISVPGSGASFTFNAEPGVSLPSCNAGTGFGWTAGCYSPSDMPSSGGWSGADVTGSWSTGTLSVGVCYTGAAADTSGTTGECTGTAVIADWDTSTPGQITVSIHY